MGIIDDAHLKGQEYAWLTTCGKYLCASDSAWINVFPFSIYRNVSSDVRGITLVAQTPFQSGLGVSGK